MISALLVLVGDGDDEVLVDFAVLEPLIHKSYQYQSSKLQLDQRTLAAYVVVSAAEVLAEPVVVAGTEPVLKLEEAEEVIARRK